MIIPVYNIEPYLRRCVDSVLAQTYTDFELILVDDGSPDNCGTIYDEYAAMDSRVRVIHQANCGVSRARNTGLDAAVGKYVYFCDGDDYVEKELLADAVRAMDCRSDHREESQYSGCVPSDHEEQQRQLPQKCQNLN